MSDEKPMSEPMKNVKIVRASRSPLNSNQWHVELECGHEGWITRTRKPTRVSECTQAHGVLAPSARHDGEPRRVLLRSEAEVNRLRARNRKLVEVIRRETEQLCPPGATDRLLAAIEENDDGE